MQHDEHVCSRHVDWQPAESVSDHVHGGGERASSIGCALASAVAIAVAAAVRESVTAAVGISVAAAIVVAIPASIGVPRSAAPSIGIITRGLLDGESASV